MTAAWEEGDAIALSQALIDRQLERGAPAGQPAWRVTGSGAVLALAGDVAAKVPPRQFGRVEMSRLVGLDLSLARRLPPSRRIALGPTAWDLGRNALVSAGRPHCWPGLLMRRLDGSRDLLLSRGQAGQVDVSCGEDLGVFFRSFHAACPVLDPAAAMGALSTERRGGGHDRGRLSRMEGSIRTLGVSGRALEKLGRVLTAIEPDALKILQDRVAGGAVRDIHGDAHMENIWFMDGQPSLADPMPFDRYRLADPLREVARVALELRRLADPPVGRAFLVGYRLDRAPVVPLLEYFALRQAVGDLLHLVDGDSVGMQPRVPWIVDHVNLWGEDDSSPVIDF